MNTMDQRMHQRGAYDIHEFENTHGRPAPSRTPDLKYNPEKAMKEAEKAYLESKGIMKKSFCARVLEFLHLRSKKHSI